MLQFWPSACALLSDIWNNDDDNDDYEDYKGDVYNNMCVASYCGGLDIYPKKSNQPMAESGLTVIGNQ